MFRSVIWVSAILLAVSCIDVQTSSASETGQTKEVKDSGTVALSEVAPELYFQLRRYPKFYGDPNTVHGGLSQRSFLLDDLGGVRDVLVDHGLYLDVSVTQFLQGNVSGGKDSGDARYNGTADYWLTFDSGKAGLWPGGAFFLHAESSWQADKSIGSDTGSLLPANFDATMPTPGVNKGFTIPEFYLVQALPANLLFLAGKANYAGLADTNFFANNERTQFTYTGLVNNPILGAFVPYTPLGAGFVWAAPNKKHSVALIGVQSKADATTSGFDNFNGEYSGGLQYQFSPILGGNLPGNYRVIAGYSNKDVPRFDIDPRHFIAGIIGLVPLAEKSENYAGLINFDQYLWVKDGDHAAHHASAEASSHTGSGRQHLPPVGIGIFGRAGWAPKDRNVIDQFYSLGIGGYGMLVPGRDNDQWGLGWAGTHISSDLRDKTSFVGIDLDSLEHAFEVFYNIEVTPAIHLTLNAQVINSTATWIDTATTVGSRLQVDF